MSQSVSDSFRNVTRYLGQDYRFTPTYIRGRDPTTSDIKPKEQQGFYPVNSLWSNSTNGNLWALIKFINSPVQAIWVLLASGTVGGILDIAVPNGTSPVFPTVAGLMTFTSSNNTVVITGSTNTIDFKVEGEGVQWQVVSQLTAPATLVVNTGYICVTGGTGNVSFALPTISSVGDLIEVTLDTATSWTITQAANQQMQLGNILTTVGVAGNMTTTLIGDSVRMVCKVANLQWQVLSSIGTLVLT